MKKTIEIFVICIIVVMSVGALNKIFKNPERFSEEAIRGYYNEKSKIDALFIGSSRVYMFWEPMLAYNEYGISSYNLTVSGQTAVGDRYLLEEALKRQSPSIIIIEMSSLVSDLNVARIHRMTDSMKFSATKFNYINEVSRQMDISGLDKLEYYIPFIRFHSRWSELSEYDFTVAPSKFKGSYWDESRFLKTCGDFEYKYIPERVEEKIDENIEKSVIELLDYIQKNDLNVFFYAAPTNDDDRKKVNYVKNILNQYNMEYFDMNYSINEIELNIPNDYCDTGHTNISGAIKFTSYLGDILQNKYSLPDHRLHEEYSEWNIEYNNYYKLIEPYLNEEEKMRLNRASMNIKYDSKLDSKQKGSK